MATPTAAGPSLEESLKLAKIQREAIAKELQKIQVGGQGANETARFEKVEKLMENLRLNCVRMIFFETRAADQKDVPDLLWSAHTSVTSAYRKVIGQLQTSDKAVLKRKIEKSYTVYLKTADGFYKGLLQRIFAFYDVKDLKRIARITELEEMKTLESGKADVQDEKLQKIAVGMCHKILVHLGDLARYRTLARAKDKDRRWGTALTYYGLANELIPESGWGYHQSGVIYTETEDHLQVVYHFYRALASEEPHPRARDNLEREFNKLRDGKARGGKGGSNDVMIAWFVKLHAHYFKGEKFTSRKELEDEVDARLAMALKDGIQTDVDMDLLKMVLINILAYQVGLNKIREKWTDSGSLSCQFILLQNVRTIQTITRLLREELTEFVHREPVDLPTGSTGQNDKSGKYSPTFHRVLPLLRVYMTWLCFSSTDLVGYKDHLEPYFGQMCKMLANALNLLFELMSRDSNITNVQKRATWRFPEDEETLGMKCLNGPGLPEATQLCYDPIDRTPKPRAEEVKGAKPTADAITLTRALDVILCALELANHSPFPIVHSKVLDGPQEQTKFIYTESGKSSVICDKLIHKPEPPVAPVSSRSVPTSTAAAVQEPLEAAPAIGTAADDSEEFSEDEEFYSGSAKINRSLAALIPPKNANSKSPAGNSSEFPLDHQIFNILNDFLVPPETEPAVKSKEAPANTSLEAESSSGMGSTTANEVFGSLVPASPNPGSATAGAFPALPWNYFNIPAPVEGGPRSASGTSSVWAQTYGQPHSRPGTSGNAKPTLSPGGETRALAYRTSGQSQNPNSVQLLPMLAGYRTSPSEQARSGAMPGANLNEHTSQTLKGSGVRNVWPSGAGSNVPPADPWSQPAGRWDLGQHSPAHQVTPKSSFPSSFALSGSNSSLPPVNSPWGVPMRAQQTAFAQGTDRTPIRMDPAQFPSIFGNSSPYMSTTQPITGITQGPPPGFGHGNGMTSNAYGNSHAAGQAGGVGRGTPRLETQEGMQAGLNSRANGHQPKVTPPPGFGLSTGRRVGSGDLSRTFAGQKTKQQPGIAAIREPYGPGANGRIGFSIPKR